MFDHDGMTMLAPYAGYIKNNHLREVALSLIRSYRDLDVPLLSKLAAMPHEEIVATTEASMAKLLTAWEQGKGKEYILERMRAWEADQLESSHINMADVDMGDIVLIGTAQRQVLSGFIDSYTREPEHRESLHQAIREHFTFARQAGTEAFFRIRLRTQ